uniref:Dynein axonemal heavy chain 14 n=1 Tax=Latimeria chalumnae TaxID=7897 RepID=H3APA3_LATCH
WIVLDGPVDMIWVENLNTALDETKTLCFANGERISMPQGIRFVFEVDSLSQASPATVSRCAMIYMMHMQDPVDLGWEPYVKTWLSHLPEELPKNGVSYLQILFEKSIEEGLNFICNFDSIKCIWIAVCTFFPIKGSKLFLQNTFFSFPIFVYREKKKWFLQKFPDKLITILGKLYVFAFTWAVGGVLKRDVSEEDSMHAPKNKDEPLVHVTAEFDNLVHDLFDGEPPVANANIIPHRNSKDSKLKKKNTCYCALKFHHIKSTTTLLSRFLGLSSLDLLIVKLICGDTDRQTKKNLIKNTVKKNITTPHTCTHSIQFSTQTSAATTKSHILCNLIRRSGENFGPPRNKKVIVFIDDLNMPAPEPYGAKPPLELIRQFLELNGFYEHNKNVWKNIDGISLVATCSVSDGGRNEISPRLLTHFCMIVLPEPSILSLQSIFQNILFLKYNTEVQLGRHFENRDFPSDVQKCGEGLVAATLAVYYKMYNNMLPTPAKSHYIFSLHDLSKVIRGLLQADEYVITTVETTVQLFAHEATRVFHDRLISACDRNVFHQFLSDELQIHFAICLPFQKLMQEPIVFGDFLPTDSPDGNRYYSPIADQKYLTSILEQYQMEHQLTKGLINHTEVPFVYFKETVDHITRAARIFRQPDGHMMLVGLNGTGKLSCATLACYLSGCSLYRLPITQSYCHADFQEDLKKIFWQTGLRRKETVLFITEADIVKESVLEDLNYILNIGEVPHLFDKEEIDRITVALKAAAIDSNIPDNKHAIYAFFLQRVRRKLHIVLATSPAGPTFRQRCRETPSFINCCTIDWYDEWPKEALLEVANSSVIKEDIGENDEELKENIAQVCVEIHESACMAAARCLEEYRRHYYISPSSFLVFINLFCSTLQTKKKEILNDRYNCFRDRYQNGLCRLSEGMELVTIMQEELIAIGPKIEQNSEDIEALMEKLESDTKIMEKIHAIVKEEEEVMNQETQVVEDYANQATNELNAVLPALYQSIANLNALRKEDISEVRVYSNPPDLVLTVMYAVCILLQHTPNWLTAKQLLGDPGFLKMLVNLDKDSIAEKVFMRLKRYTKDPDFNPEKVGLVSVACRPMCQWVLALEKYHEVHKAVQPKKDKVMEANEALVEIQENLKQKRKNLFRIEEHLQNLQQKYADSIAERKALAEKKIVTTQRLQRATVLISVLDDEQIIHCSIIEEGGSVYYKFSKIKEVNELCLRPKKLNLILAVLPGHSLIALCYCKLWLLITIARWKEVTDELNHKVQNITGDVLISAALIVYSDVLTANYRRMMVKEWIGFCNSYNVPVSQDYNLVKVMVDKNQLRSWHSAGLPLDQYSMENAVLVKMGQLWPLLIDPQKQIYKWICQMEGDMLQKVHATDPNYLRIVQSAIELGKPVLLQNVSERLDPSLMPVLAKNIYRKDGQDFIRIGNNEIKYDHNFRLYMTTQIANPRFLPAVCITITLINFTVTIESLQDQLLSSVVRHEYPELEEQHDQLLESLTADLLTLQELEKKSLTLLQRTGNDILDDNDLIDTLQRSKVTSKEIKQRVQDSEAIEREIKAAREKYHPIANRGAVLYFTVVELLQLNYMYQFSLDWFLQLYLSSISPRTQQLRNSLRAHFIRAIAALTENVHKVVSNALFSDHQLCFSFMICTNIMRNNVTESNTLDTMGFLPKSVNELDRNDSPVPWLTDTIWKQCHYISTHLKSFSHLCESLISNPQQWNYFWRNDEALESPRTYFPWEKLSSFQRLILISVLKPECLTSAVREFVVEKLGSRFVRSGGSNLKGVYSSSNANIPFIFILSPGADPSIQFLRFATEMRGNTQHVHMMSLGKGQGPKAEELINKAQILKGRWVFLQNCHLAASFMPQLESIVEVLCRTSSVIDLNFRLWLSSKPDPSFPVSILQSGIKVAVEPIHGLKGMLLQTFGSDGEVTEKIYDNEKAGPLWKKLLFNLCFFSAVIHGRKKYGSLGWNFPYEFTSSDLEVSIQILEMLVNDQSEIPWSALRCLTGEVVYGGHVTDYWDQRCLLHILESFYNPTALQQGCAFSSDKEYWSLSEEANLEECGTYIRTLPDADSPEIFGMHLNAEKTFLENQAQAFIDTIITMQPQLSTACLTTSGGKSQDEMVLEMASDILRRLPEAVEKKYGLKPGYDSLVHSATPMFLYQEIERFNHLLSVIHSSLHSLSLAVKGTIILTDELEQVYNSFLNMRVCELWQKHSYESCKMLGSWIDDLIQRIDFFGTWAEQNSPVKIFWLSGFFFPQGFLTAVLQNYARQKGVSVDSLTFTYRVLSTTTDKDGFHSNEGILVFGLYLDGARWDSITQTLGESQLGQRFSCVPMIHFLPQNAPDQNSSVLTCYKCPLYQTSKRAGTLASTGLSTNFVTAVHLPTSVSPSHWVIRGVALLCQLDD